MNQSNQPDQITRSQGGTTRAILQELIKTIGDQYAAELAALPLKKQTRDCLIDGFRSGVAHGVNHAVKMFGVKVEGE